jgi:hypothetical protein
MNEWPSVLHSLLILVFLFSACAPYTFRLRQMTKNEEKSKAAYESIGLAESEEENDKRRDEFHLYRDKREHWFLMWFVIDLPYYIFLLWLYNHIV